MPQPRHPDLVVLGRAIRAIRDEHGLTASGLAAASGVPESSIAALEDGRLDADFELLLDIATGLGVRPAELFVRAEELAARAGP